MSPDGSEPSAREERTVSATVIVTQWVKPGRDEEVGEWQDDVSRAVAAFPGFFGTEVVPPREGSDEWTVIYRFDSETNLKAWLSSSARSELLERGEDLFAAPASQRILIGEEDEEELVTVVVSHPVDPEHEGEFLAWQERVTQAERGFPGFRGSELFRPVPGAQRDWTAIYRFDTDEHLTAWLESPARQRLLDQGRHFGDFELRRISSPFGSWFSFAGPGDTADAPPDWKTALSVLVGLYPTVVLITLAISELWEDGELWETLLLGNVVSVALLTWVVMPVVARALRFWLAPDPGSADPHLDAAGAALSIAFLTACAFVFWLVTTQIWTLP